MVTRSRLGGCTALIALLLALPVSMTAAAETAPVAGVFTVDSASDSLDASFSCPTVTPDALPGPDGSVSLREAICALPRVHSLGS